MVGYGGRLDITSATPARKDVPASSNAAMTTARDGAKPSGTPRPSLRRLSSCRREHVLLPRLRPPALAPTTSLFAATILSPLLAYAYQLLVARTLSPLEFALFIAITSILTISAVLLQALQWAIAKLAV